MGAFRLLVLMLILTKTAYSQNTDFFVVKVVGTQQKTLSSATVELLRTDGSLVKVAITDSLGLARFEKLPAQNLLVQVTMTGFAPQTAKLDFPRKIKELLVVLLVVDRTMESVVVVTKKNFIEQHPDKTVINLEAGIANVGTTVLEALEKLPGITIDKNGNINLKGRSGVLVMLDGKPTYLDGASLATLLGGMSASQISQVELMDNPPAKFDAAGNAGIINIKTKKNIQRGFNGTLTNAYGQGFYPKGNTNLSMNYKAGRWNLFLNYGFNANEYFTRIYALRTYFESGTNTTKSLLEQPSFLRGNSTTNNLRTGIDYNLTENTTLGVTINGVIMHRHGSSNNPALWMKPDRQLDSLINTTSSNTTNWKNAGAAFHFRHSFDASRELTTDADYNRYTIGASQNFENVSVFPGSYREASSAQIPNEIRILSGKADYTQQFKDVKLETGWKSSNIQTDNLADYLFNDGMRWRQDLGKSNHFLYNEDIHAFYGSAQGKINRWSLQGGLRYEMTSYDAKQLGNAAVKDSSFSRNYSGLFPSLFLTFEKDSINTFSFSAGRRIDRPAFQKLNPFIFIINKYTFQQGNPYYRPQFTWNMEFSHLYKNLITTSLSYSLTTDYFSQVFPIDRNGIVLYTEGNLGKLHNLGLSVGLNHSPQKWWTLSLQTVLNRKKMEGIISRPLSATITQYNINLNNQFRFKKGWGGEISGFYNSRSQHDIQEVVDPSGQLSMGVSKTVLDNAGTIKIAVRDIFYTNWIKGLTQFDNATEYFKLTRDTRVFNISFSWRFGKAFKTQKRSEGASRDEIQRVGNG